MGTPACFFVEKYEKIKNDTLFLMDWSNWPDPAYWQGDFLCLPHQNNSDNRQASHDHNR